MKIYLFALYSFVSTIQSVTAQRFSPPAKPSIAPLIAATYANDTNADRVDDQLLSKAEQALIVAKRSISASQKAAAQATLGQMVEVELIFKEQVTQQQIDSFIAQGGQITYLYKAVSFGWNGRLPLSQVPSIPLLMGGSLLLIEESKPARLHMDTATRIGRVRPIWAAGFAGNPAGFQGDSSITIAICDTGADESHTDLNGRRVYWNDFSTDGAFSPTDLVQHGTHVMGIAAGSGAASGNGTSTLKFTDEGTLAGVPNGSFVPTPFELPVSSPVTVTFTATWNGGGSTTLDLLTHTKGVSAFSQQGSSVTGTSPLTLTQTFTPLASRVYSPGLLSNGSMTDYNTVCQVTGYPGAGDGFNKFRGVAPGCNWGCAKVFTSSGSGNLNWTSAAIDDLVAVRAVRSIKVINLSLGAGGSPGISTSTRQKVNTAVNNGVVVVVSAGNDGGSQQVDDPGRAAMALTVAAANDANQLTDYSSEGFASPGSTPGLEEDYKPDLMAPGGSSTYYSAIMSVDSNSGDGPAFADQQANDYFNIQGTSMSSPFAAGCAALVIDALQQSGVAWDFSSSQHSRLVKMVLCATASESNTSREGNTSNPTLQRANAGPNGFPAGKDQFEGYGMINPDAAVEAVSLTHTVGATNTASLGPAATDRRVWARTVHLAAGQSFGAGLTVPGVGDDDLYLYSATPSAYGTPVLLASSTRVGSGLGESLSYLPAVATDALLVVKRVIGSGTFSVASYTPPSANFNSDVTNGAAPLTVSFTNLSSAAVSFAWDFGDGKTSTAASPVNTFTNAGVYSVQLKALNPAGTNTLTRIGYIIVTNPPPPIVDFAANVTNGFAPLTVNFTNRSSGASGYYWDFGDGNNSLLSNPTNVYASAGTYTVTLTASGAGGTNSLTRSNLIQAINAPFLNSPFLIGPDFVLSFQTVTGRTYEVQYKDSLDDSDWQVLQSVPGDGSVLSVTNSVSSPAQRFFRLNVH